MSKFILLLHESPESFDGLSPEDMQGVIQEYSAWRDELAASGKLVGSDKLEDGTARHLVPNNGRIEITDGPFAETKEVIGGFFMIEADDYDGAVEISRRCPHVKYGSRIEVRRIDELH